LAHAQVLMDVVILNAAIYVTGGGASPLWPFSCLTLLAAGLFFPRPLDVVLYGAFTVAMFAVANLLHGRIEPSLLLLAALVTTVGFITVYFGKRMDELLRMRNEMRHKDEVLSLVSHELNNPLATLKASLHLVRRKGPTADRSLARIDASVDRMVRIVGDLYDVTSLQAGQLRIEPQVTDLVLIVTDVAERFRTLHPGLTIAVEGPTASWGSWDAHRLDQLMTNLLQNAAKYAGDAAQVRIALYPASGGTVHVSIADNGPGIPAERLPTIFEPFQRADGTGKKGLGLGLALARQIAVLHGGALWAESNRGAGTVFHIRLPTGGVRPPS
jgi:signal transduction histidine kinase